jgi:exonuclease SbcD
MKFLHMGDIHVGKTLNGYSLEKDLDYVMAQAAELVREQNIDAVLVAGDLYDVAAPSASAMQQVERYLSAFREAGAQVVVAPGNHDNATRVGYLGEFLRRQGIHMAGAYDGAIEPVVLEDEHGPVYVWPLPYVRPLEVRAALDLTKDEVPTHNEAVAAVIKRLPLDPTVRNVAVAHQFVTSGSRSPERAASELSMGDSDAVAATHYAPFDYVALGHLHVPQRVGKDTVRYAGSPLAYSVGEARVPKSWCVVELGAKDVGAPVDSAAAAEKNTDNPTGFSAEADVARANVQVELVPVEPLHEVVRLKGTLEELCAANAPAAGEAPHDAFVEVTLTSAEMPLDAQARLKQLFPHLLTVRLEQQEREEAAGEELSLEALEEASLSELFEAFYQEQTGRELTPEQLAYVTEHLEQAVRGEE